MAEGSFEITTDEQTDLRCFRKVFRDEMMKMPVSEQILSGFSTDAKLNVDLLSSLFNTSAHNTA